MSRVWRFNYHDGWQGVASTGETTAIFPEFEDVIEAIENGDFS